MNSLALGNTNDVTSDPYINALVKTSKKNAWSINDITWGHPPLPLTKFPRKEHSLQGWEPYEELESDQKIQIAHSLSLWSEAQMRGGEEKGTLIVVKMYEVACATLDKDNDFTLYIGQQLVEERNHTTAFNELFRRRRGNVIDIPLNPSLDSFFNALQGDNSLPTPMQLCRLIVAIQVVIESLALASFRKVRALTNDPVLQQMLGLVLQDEGRHTVFGRTAIKKLMDGFSLSQEERDTLTRWAAKVCKVMYNNLTPPKEIFESFGLNPEEGTNYFVKIGQAGFRKNFSHNFMGTLSEAGLVTEETRHLFAEFQLPAATTSDSTLLGTLPSLSTITN